MVGEEAKMIIDVGCPIKLQEIHVINGLEDYSNGPIKNNKALKNCIAFGNEESMDQDTKKSTKGLSNHSNMTLNGGSNSSNESDEQDFSSITRRYAYG